MHRTVVVAAAPVELRSDAPSIERGRYLYASRGCADCHGSNGAGGEVINDGQGLLVRAPNITPAPGSVVSDYGPSDWARSIRHGVNPQGQPLLVMPSEDYNRLTDRDLSSVVAYVRQLPAVQGGGAVLQLPLPMKLAYAAGLMKDAAEKINHALPPAQPVEEGVTPEHGAYVANACIGCHGPTLAGGRIPGAPPDWPAAADLSKGPQSAMARYQDADSFARLFRTGLRPDGSRVSPVMPFQALGAMSDTDVEGALPPPPAAARRCKPPPRRARINRRAGRPGVAGLLAT